MIATLLNLFINIDDKIQDLRLLQAGGFVSIFLFAIFGECNYDRLPTSGPFQVSCHEFHSKEL